MSVKESLVGDDNIYVLIERKGEEMVEIASKKGFMSIETLRCSKELDSLINIYQTLSKKE